MADLRTNDLVVTQEELNSLSELREFINANGLKLQEVGLNNDWTLLRFLRSKEMNIQNAFNALVMTQHFRYRHGLFENSRQHRVEKFENFRKFYSHSVYNTDKEGRPLCIEMISRSDIFQACESLPSDEIESYFVQFLERLVNIVFPVLSENYNRRIDKIVAILDLRGAPLMKIFSGRPMSILKVMVSTFQNHYPEILHKLVIINAPMVFSALLGVIKMYLGASTVSKLEILSGPGTTRLLELIDEEKLPGELGGTCEAPLARGSGLFRYFVEESKRSGSLELNGAPLREEWFDVKASTEAKTRRRKLDRQFLEQGNDDPFMNHMLGARPVAMPGAIVPTMAEEDFKNPPQPAASKTKNRFIEPIRASLSPIARDLSKPVLESNGFFTPALIHSLNVNNNLPFNRESDKFNYLWLSSQYIAPNSQIFPPHNQNASRSNQGLYPRTIPEPPEVPDATLPRANPLHSRPQPVTNAQVQQFHPSSIESLPSNSFEALASNSHPVSHQLPPQLTPRHTPQATPGGSQQMVHLQTTPQGNQASQPGSPTILLQRTPQVTQQNIPDNPSQSSRPGTFNLLPKDAPQSMLEIPHIYFDQAPEQAPKKPLSQPTMLMQKAALPPTLLTPEASFSQVALLNTVPISPQQTTPFITSKAAAPFKYPASPVSSPLPEMLRSDLIRKAGFDKLALSVGNLGDFELAVPSIVRKTSQKPNMLG